ncbi:hypothetical protein O6H91_21G017000 [Diphasiastrum complanatum]|uniref:Uncharacterized protein n=1 Tax=Diphasiastrum complanatum TaxID=34168 RepID=A0ACC2AIB9_DIPCM|nr:hypothetical protein O6H91_21G017000 [Diphasiastrum complanatum]
MSTNEYNNKPGRQPLSVKIEDKGDGENPARNTPAQRTTCDENANKNLATHTSGSIGDSSNSTKPQGGKHDLGDDRYGKGNSSGGKKQRWKKPLVLSGIALAVVGAVLFALAAQHSHKDNSHDHNIAAHERSDKSDA